MPPPKNLKRKHFNQPEEITFDFSARQDYLTGFHKRKLERVKHAQTVAARKEKESRLEARRQLRAERKADLERYVKSVDELIAKPEDSWHTDSDPPEDERANISERVPLDHEENYSDEDRNTTVVVEEVDVTRQGFRKIDVSDRNELIETKQMQPSSGGPAGNNPESTKRKRTWAKNAPERHKQKKKKFRYETKAERKITKSKERSGGAKAKARRKGYF